MPASAEADSSSEAVKERMPPFNRLVGASG
jgi:hypothetical protein